MGAGFWLTTSKATNSINLRQISVYFTQNCIWPSEHAQRPNPHNLSTVLGGEARQYLVILGLYYSPRSGYGKPLVYIEDTLEFISQI